MSGAVARWSSGPSCPPAPDAEVHVWRADLDLRRDRAATFAALCDRAELSRAADMRTALYRDRFVIRRGLHRVLLGGYAVARPGVEPVTATGQLGADALFAFGGGVGLGVSIVPVPDGDPAVGRLPWLTTRERLGLAARDRGARARATAVVLAAKEALGNARGRGLDDAVGAVEMLPVVDPVLGGGGFGAEFDGLSWSGTVLELGPERLACVIHDGARRPVRAWTVGC